MATLSLKISLEGGRVTKTIQFDPQTTIFDACKIIRDKFAEAVQGERKLNTIFCSVIIMFALYKMLLSNNYFIITLNESRKML